MADLEHRNTTHRADGSVRPVWHAPRLTEHAIIDNTEFNSTGSGTDGTPILKAVS